MRIKIALTEVRVNDVSRQKIQQKHGLNADDVEQALRSRRYIWAKVEYSENGHWHVAAPTTLYDGVPFIAYLYPEPPSARERAERWSLATAIPT